MGLRISINDIGSISVLDKVSHTYRLHLKNGNVVDEQIPNDFDVGRIKLAIGQKSDLNWSKEQQERGIEENKKGGSISIGFTTIVFAAKIPAIDNSSAFSFRYFEDIFFVNTIGQNTQNNLKKLINDYTKNRCITQETFKTSWAKEMNKFLNETRKELNIYEKSKL